MQNFIKQEQFELEVLDKLNSSRLLNSLVFCGGTMLRLCYGLNRFSVDLDFWLAPYVNKNVLFKKIKECLTKNYKLTDCANKFFTLLFEIKSPDYPRCLKIEIRKERRRVKTEQAIAYSPYSTKQVLIKVVSLNDMMLQKIYAFVERKEIRDAFDIEFLLKRGINLNGSSHLLKNVLKNLDSLTQKDYSVKLGSLLEANQREYYIKQNFKILRLALKEILASYS